MGTEQKDEIEIDIKELLFVIRKKLWIIIVAGLVCAAVVGICTVTLIKPLYTSSTMLYILNKSTSLTSLADLQLGTQLTKDYKVMVISRPVTSQVIKNLDLNLEHEKLIKKVKVDNPADTRILTIAVEDTDPYMAKAIADEFARIASQRMAEIMDTVPPNIVEEGYLPTRKTSPSIIKNTLIGGLAGIFAACAVILILFVMNDSIKTPEDVEKYLGLNTLGMIPYFDQSENRRKKKKRWGRLLKR